MNNIHLLIIALLLAAFFATYTHAQPESDIATPISTNYERSIPNIGNAESENWQRLREERKAVREQILANIKDNLKSEKKELQQEKIQPTKSANFKTIEAREKNANENAIKHREEILPPGLKHEKNHPEPLKMLP